MQKTNSPTSTEDTGSGSKASRPTRRSAFLIAAFVGLIAGLVASLVAVLLMGILRIAAGVPTPIELFGDFVLKHISVNTFIQLLIRFGSSAKTAPLGLALLGIVGLGTILGLVYAAVVRLKLPLTGGYRPSRREWLTAAVFAVAMAAIAIILFWNELPQNFFGLPIAWATFVTATSLVADFVLYSLTLCLVYRALLPKESLETTSRAAQGRRQLLTRAGVAVLGIGAGLGTFGTVRGFLNNFASYDGMTPSFKNGFTPPITPNSDHYVVTQNPVDPAVNTDLWRLEVTGLVGNGGTYSYQDIQNLPSTTRPITLECIANGVGGRLISTAVWQGVTLRSLLAKHGGAQSSAKYVAFYSVDGYATSLPLDEVLTADPLLAWRMNGAELPPRHGYPLRALIPGRYGEEQPKWLTRIELTDHFVGGLYSDQGWYNGPLHTMSRINRPLGGTLPVGHATEVAGLAFAGNRGIQKVEVSVDGGTTWNAAKLDPPISEDSWIFWTWQWTPATPGKVTIMARATDGTGAVQTSQQQGTVPNGATGYPTTIVAVM